MNIVAEKEKILKRISDEQDENVIHAVMDFLDNVSNTHPTNDKKLTRELDLAIKEADDGELLSYDAVIAEFRKKYSA